MIAQPHVDEGLQYIAVVLRPGHVSIDFDMTLDGAPARMMRWSDGSVLVGAGKPVDDDSGFEVLAQIAAPWAFDAVGEEVASRYEVAHGVLSLVVEPAQDTTFPLVADPTVSWVPHGVLSCGWTTCTYYLERQSTYNVKAITSWSNGNGWIVATAASGTACSLLGGPTVVANIVAGFGCSVFMGIYGNSIAAHSREAGWGCLTLKYYHVPWPPSFGHVDGHHSNCHYDAD